MRKIARWTLGPVSKDGKDVLCESVNKFQELYPEFERWICYNHTSIEDLNLNAFFLKQENTYFLLSDPNPDEKWEPVGCGWKLVPPRIDINSYELFIDNDVVFTKKIPSINEWLESDLPLISKDIYRIFGNFDHLVRKDLKVCAALFGLPPGFDFEQKINQVLGKNPEPLGGFSEQGLTASIVTNEEDWIQNSDFYVSTSYNEKFPSPTPSVIHFSAVNRSAHVGWSIYKSKCLKFL